jgi:hypothetical protein
MTEKDVIKIFINIENCSPIKIDGNILACAMKLVYRAGLQKNEIPILTIGDVYDQDRNVRNKIIKKEIKKGGIIVPADIHNELKDYYDYLESHEKHSTADTDPLFPGYYSDSKNQENELKKIGLHLEKIDPDYNKLIHYLHELGISDLNKQGFSEKKIADQFRITVESVHNSIFGTIPPHGTAKRVGVNLLTRKQLEHNEKLDTLDCTDIEKIKAAIDDCYYEIDSLPDKGLKKSGQGSKEGAFETYLRQLLRKFP